MQSPKVVEILRRLEPVTADPFIATIPGALTAPPVADRRARPTVSRRRGEPRRRRGSGSPVALSRSS